MEILTKTEEEMAVDLLGYKPKKINLNGKNFYIKYALTKCEHFYEIISKKLVDEINIFCPQYRFFEKDGDIFIYSEDLEIDGTLIMASSILSGKNKRYLPNVCDNLSKKFDNSKDLIDEMIKLYIFDIIFMQADRNEGNWGVLVRNDGSSSIAILDNTHIFNIDELPIIFSFMNTDLVREHGVNNYIENILEEVKFFLENYPLEYAIMFKNMLEIYNNDFVSTKLLETIHETGYKIPTSKISAYGQLRKALVELVNQHICDYQQS